jgi:hypothetical protein
MAGRSATTKWTLKFRRVFKLMTCSLCFTSDELSVQTPSSLSAQQIPTPVVVINIGDPTYIGQAPNTFEESSDQGLHVAPPTNHPPSSHAPDDVSLARSTLSSEGAQKDSVHASLPADEDNDDYGTSSNEVSLLLSCSSPYLMAFQLSRIDGTNETTPTSPAGFSTNKGAISGNKSSADSMDSSPAKPDDTSGSSVQGTELTSKPELTIKLRNSTPHFVAPMVSPRHFGPISTLELTSNPTSRSGEGSKPAFRSFRYISSSCAACSCITDQSI